MYEQALLDQTPEDPFVEVLNTNQYELPIPEWERLEDGQNRYANFITDLPTQVFAVHRPPPNIEGVGANGNEENAGWFEFGIDPRALGEVEAGTYRIRYDVGGDVDATVIRDESGTFFSFSKHENADAATAAAEYTALAKLQPPNLLMPFGQSVRSYFDEIFVEHPSRMTETALPTNVWETYIRLGFKVQEIDGQKRLLYPSPQTLETVAAKRATPIKVIHSGKDQHSYVEPHDYQDSFAEGLYPIGSADLFYYLHDIDNDHFPGAMLGYLAQDTNTATFLQILAPVIAKMNSEGKPSVDELDLITSHMTGILNRLDGSSYSHNDGPVLTTLESDFSSLYMAAGMVYDSDRISSSIYGLLAAHLRALGGEDNNNKAAEMDLFPALRQAQIAARKKITPSAGSNLR